MHPLVRRAGSTVAALAVAASAVGALTARLADAAPATTMIVSEIAPWGSSTTSYGADWFELTNTGPTPISIAGWKVDDSSYSAGAALALNGVTSVAAGESVIFLEGNASTISAFKLAWFGSSAVTSPQVGSYSGSGIGLSTSGDAVVVYNAAGVVQTAVSFGTNGYVAPPGTNLTFDNAAGLGSTTATAASPPVAVTTPSVAGTNGAFQAPDAAAVQIGSPGTAPQSGGGPASTTTTVPPTTTTVAGPAYLPWPGSPSVATVDAESTFSSNLSGLDDEGSGGSGPGTLWAVVNGPGTLHRLVFDGVTWGPDAADGWSAGKALRYPDGLGDPDAEGVTMIGDSSAAGLFVATERNNAASGTSRKSILRFDPAGAGSTLTATNEWNLTADIPPAAGDANLGLEAITWIDDAYLVANHLVDDAKGRAYDPADYAHHGTGLFLVGVEATGTVYVYALDLRAGSSAFTRITSFSSGFTPTTVMDLQFDRDLQELWAVCDNTCAGRTHVLRLDPASGRFGVVRRYERPSGMPNTNNEGFAIGAATECTDGAKPVFWSDDNDLDRFSLRTGTLPCGVTEPPALVNEFPSAALPVGVLVLGGGIAALVQRRRRMPRV